MDQWLLAVTSGSVAKGSAIDLEIADSGLLHCYFLPFSQSLCVVHNVVLGMHTVQQFLCVHLTKVCRLMLSTYAVNEYSVVHLYVYACAHDFFTAEF